MLNHERYSDCYIHCFMFPTFKNDSMRTLLIYQIHIIIIYIINISDSYESANLIFLLRGSIEKEVKTKKIRVTPK